MKFHSIFIVLSAAAMILLGMGLRTRAAPVPGDEETNMAQVMPDINGKIELLLNQPFY